ncbi:UDP-N-acetylglucosamine pyrophosphorylase [Monosporozyma unispora]|nr:UDP-N-acetylglucosamine pyrophosphorylase [Kazachstania unispora]
MTWESIEQLYKDAGQEGLFYHVNSLSKEDKLKFHKNLLKVANREPPAKLIKDCQDAINLHEANGAVGSTSIKPLPPTSYQSIIGDEKTEMEYYKLGHDAIQRGEVAIILMAGGQGTRLGSTLPKGCYDINLPSHKSLFQIQSEKIVALQKSCPGCIIPWYIMTSAPTRQATEKFFQENDYFHLQKDQIVFFNQGTLPAFSSNGEHLLLANQTDLFESPDGNGGLYRSLKDNHIIDDFHKRGIKHIYVYCVDNVLSRLADPVFIGFAIKHGFQLATKAVRKRDAHEPVGLIATRNNRPCVIEYSEISRELAESTNEEGLLQFRAGNIVNHYYHIDLLSKSLDQWCNTIPYHVAKKKITYYDNIKDQYFKPEEPNGIKLEQFIFDVFPTIPLDKFGCLEVERSKEFSPLKNGPGSKVDNPDTSRLAYLKLGTQWLKDAGAIVKDGVLVEVSNKLSYGGENLLQFNGKEFNEDGFYLE